MMRFVPGVLGRKQRLADFVNTGQDALTRHRRCAWDLETMHIPRRGTEHQVGEGSSDIGSDRIARVRQNRAPSEMCQKGDTSRFACPPLEGGWLRAGLTTNIPVCWSRQHEVLPLGARVFLEFRPNVVADPVGRHTAPGGDCQSRPLADRGLRQHRTPGAHSQRQISVIFIPYRAPRDVANPALFLAADEAARLPGSASRSTQVPDDFRSSLKLLWSEVLKRERYDGSRFGYS